MWCVIYILLLFISDIYSARKSGTPSQGFYNQSIKSILFYLILFRKLNNNQPLKSAWTEIHHISLYTLVIDLPIIQ